MAQPSPTLLLLEDAHPDRSSAQQPILNISQTKSQQLAHSQRYSHPLACLEACLDFRLPYLTAKPHPVSPHRPVLINPGYSRWQRGREEKNWRFVHQGHFIFTRRQPSTLTPPISSSTRGYKCQQCPPASAAMPIHWESTPWDLIDVPVLRCPLLCYPREHRAMHSAFQRASCVFCKRGCQAGSLLTVTGAEGGRGKNAGDQGSDITLIVSDCINSQHGPGWVHRPGILTPASPVSWRSLIVFVGGIGRLRRGFQALSASGPLTALNENCHAPVCTSVSQC
ncbi:unnamed protein product [Pleuronectes platessa]|uniref:Uncharacterized protein n=1 Tax=Pleuronectes platessa TaxID=8262 RepID=A0A9N7Z5H4_PLEPL|nr:unnamed protein product [Pleuronectes platessa]